MASRVALVTGGSRGIGRPVALRLAAAGQVIPCRADLEDPAAVQAMFDRTAAEAVRLDWLVTI